MTIYVDSIQQYSSGPWCHMASDDLDELHRFAAKLRLRRAWFQDHAVMPHYDLRPSKRLLAIERGAIEVSRYELLALCTDKYPSLRERTLKRLAEKETKVNETKQITLKIPAPELELKQRVQAFNFGRPIPGKFGTIIGRTYHIGDSSFSEFASGETRQIIAKIGWLYTIKWDSDKPFFSRIAGAEHLKPIDNEQAAVDYLESLKNRDLPDGMIVDEWKE